MTTPYVTANGFQIPTEEETLQRIADEVHADIDPNVDMSPEAPTGQIAGIFVNRLREHDEGMQVAYDAFNEAAAEDFALDALCALTGTTRPEATKSTVTATVNLDANKTVAKGAVVAQENNPTVQFVTIEDVTSTTAGDYPVACEATVTGPVVCNAGTLTVIVTPVVGWNSVTNAEDAAVGHARFDDVELRQRRRDELRARGGGTIDSIGAALLQLRVNGSAPILNAVANENVTDYVNDDGVPPKSIEAIIFDGIIPAASNDAVAQIIWDRKAAGASSFGNTSGTAVDVNNEHQTVYFSRPSVDNLKMAITVDVSANNPAAFAGVQAVKDAIVAMFREKAVLGVRSVRATHYAKAVIRTADGKGVFGVLDAPNIQINNILLTGFPASYTNYVLGPRVIAQLDSSDITVTVVEVAP